MRKLVGLVAAAALLAVGCAQDDSDPHGDAFYACAEFMKQRLKSPATADFPNYYSDTSTVTGEGPTYRVNSYVDSQNSFGANIRTGFTCVVTDIGDNWQLNTIKID